MIQLWQKSILFSKLQVLKCTLKAELRVVHRLVLIWMQVRMLVRIIASMVTMFRMQILKK